jgi:hypothetical protein
MHETCRAESDWYSQFAYDLQMTSDRYRFRDDDFAAVEFLLLLVVLNCHRTPLVEWHRPESHTEDICLNLVHGGCHDDRVVCEATSKPCINKDFRG